MYIFDVLLKEVSCTEISRMSLLNPGLWVEFPVVRIVSWGQKHWHRCLFVVWLLIGRKFNSFIVTFIVSNVYHHGPELWKAKLGCFSSGIGFSQTCLQDPAKCTYLCGLLFVQLQTLFILHRTCVYCRADGRKNVKIYVEVKTFEFCWNLKSYLFSTQNGWQHSKNHTMYVVKQLQNKCQQKHAPFSCLVII